ncbi:Coproporphyrinogen oxidase (NAD) [Bifidobacterium magnum]|uniref:Heme chaperone HemW n=1 Tax=Bifidobacterium magnum TaxID=1692 RepID=A0A087B6D2_9BIFI|nr:Coproporphyrinogen oxidase (NAD) [Bifidobacterium magnum]
MRRCGYCDFNTYTATDLGGGASRTNYANLAIRDMCLTRAWQEAHGVHEPAASSVFFGGGTPTLLPASDLARMLQAVRDTWGVAPGAEITTEANPDTLDDAYVAELADAGFTRISFGMQSAVPHVLRTLDRTHTPSNVEAGVRAADRHGLRSSVDLIYGAPGESLEDWTTSVRTAIGLGVNHVSAYALTVEPETKMGRKIAAGTLPKPDDDDEAAKYEIADRLLSEAGFQWYEVSNWARPGMNRATISATGATWTGPASARARTPTTTPRSHQPGHHTPTDSAPRARRRGEPVEPAGDTTTAAVRSWEIAHPKRWAQAMELGRVPWQDSETINPTEAGEEELLLGLRLRDGFDTTALAGAIPESAWSELEKEGLIRMEGERAVPTLRGRLLNDTIITRLMQYV